MALPSGRYILRPTDKSASVEHLSARCRSPIPGFAFAEPHLYLLKHNSEPRTGTEEHFVAEVKLARGSPLVYEPVIKAIFSAANAIPEPCCNPKKTL